MTYSRNSCFSANVDLLSVSLEHILARRHDNSIHTSMIKPFMVLMFVKSIYGIILLH